MDSKILVIGASGKVGSALVRHLAGLGVATRAGVRNLDIENELPEGMEPVAFDYEKPGLMRAALTDVKILFLMTPPDNRQVDWATRAIDHAVDVGVERVVRLSIAAAPMVPGIQIGRWHRTVERYLMASGLDWTVIRPVPYMQNFLGMFPRRNGTEYYAPLGQGKVSYIDVEDVGAFCAWALTHSEATGQTFTITGNDVLAAKEAIATINQSAQVKLRYTAANKAVWRQDMLEKGMPEWFVGVLSELFSVLGTGKVSAVSDTFKEKLGRDPVTFEQFVQRNAKAFQAMPLSSAA